jgi:hypothetical protein
MGAVRRKHTAEVKTQAVGLVAEQVLTISNAAREATIRSRLLREPGELPESPAILDPFRRRMGPTPKESPPPGGESANPPTPRAESMNPDRLPGRGSVSSP